MMRLSSGWESVKNDVMMTNYLFSIKSSKKYFLFHLISIFVIFFYLFIHTLHTLHLDTTSYIQRNKGLHLHGVATHVRMQRTNGKLILWRSVGWYVHTMRDDVMPLT